MIERDRWIDGYRLHGHTPALAAAASRGGKNETDNPYTKTTITNKQV